MLRLILLICLLPLHSWGQKNQSYTPNGHSHNDYAGKEPFTLAYILGYGSIEADIWLVRDTLWVGHVPKDIEQHRSLEEFYLHPLADRVNANHGRTYPDGRHALQMMIDIKTAAGPTLDALIREIGRHPELISAKGLTWTISGNRPPDSTYMQYPPHILFDGDILSPYAPAPLTRIPMMSANLADIIKWKGDGPMDQPSEARLRELIRKAHQQGKKVRFWNAPDRPEVWAALLTLDVDYINTDMVKDFSAYMREK